jgi:hypothetical protein
MPEVFPHGCCLVPDSIAEAQDYDEKTKKRTPSIDKVTGTKVWQCRVSDLVPELAGRSRETVVKILADRMPVPSTRQPFELVEFEGMTVTPSSGVCSCAESISDRANRTFVHFIQPIDPCSLSRRVSLYRLLAGCIDYWPDDHSPRSAHQRARP